MRADRLLELLLLLQARGKMTAHQLADELEVSERTIYRDIDALTLAGVPIYAEVGQDGGYSLLEEYRTDLTGLTPHELRAIFALSVPAPLRELGIADDLRSALSKLAAASQWVDASVSRNTQQRIHIDSSPWLQTGEPVPHLQIINSALWENRLLQVTYSVPYAPVTVALTLAPYGLVAKGGDWYLVCHHDERMRVYSLSDLVSVEPRNEHFDRHEDFDLISFWQLWLRTYEQRYPVFEVIIRVLPQHHEAVVKRFATRITSEDAVLVRSDDAAGRLTLHFRSFDAARSTLLGLGGAVEVLSPTPLRAAMADYAQQILLRYQT